MVDFKHSEKEMKYRFVDLRRNLKKFACFFESLRNFIRESLINLRKFSKIIAISLFYDFNLISAIRNLCSIKYFYIMKIVIASTILTI